jgi:hypothetical protein
MESKIANNLKPEYQPVAVVWNDTISADTIQFKKRRFGCTLYLFTAACKQGKITGGSRESISCSG